MCDGFLLSLHIKWGFHVTRKKSKTSNQCSEPSTKEHNITFISPPGAQNRNKMSGLLTDFFMQRMTNPLWWAKLGLLFVDKIL